MLSETSVIYRSKRRNQKPKLLTRNQLKLARKAKPIPKQKLKHQRRKASPSQRAKQLLQKHHLRRELLQKVKARNNLQRKRKHL